MVRRDNIAGRRGMMLIWFAILLAALMAFVSLGVDLGRVQLAKTELQRAADAAARYGASAVSQDTSIALARAITAAGENDVDGSPVALQGADVEIGSWDSSARAFTVGALPANAVRITARRTAARGNPIPLLFARAIGIQSCDVIATAIATASGSAGSGTGFIGVTEIKAGNNTDMAGYDPNLGAPGGANQYATAGAQSNQKIDFGNNTSILGTASGPSGTEFKFGNNSTVSGGQTTLPSPLNFSNTEAPPVGSSGNLNMGNNQTTTLPTGTYNYTQINAGNNCTLQFSGPATLYVTDKVAMGNNAKILPYNNDPSNLQIRGVGDAGMDLGNNSKVYGHVYMPDGEFKTGNNAEVRGWVVADKLTTGNNAHLYYDQQPIDSQGSGDGSGGSGTSIALVE